MGVPGSKCDSQNFSPVTEFVTNLSCVQRGKREPKTQRQRHRTTTQRLTDVNTARTMPPPHTAHFGATCVRKHVRHTRSADPLLRGKACGPFAAAAVARPRPQPRPRPRSGDAVAETGANGALHMTQRKQCGWNMRDVPACFTALSTMGVLHLVHRGATSFA